MPLITAKVDGVIRSSISAGMPYKGWISLYYFGTHKDYRKMGLGTKVLKKAKAYATRNNCGLYLGCAPYGDGAMSHEDTRKYYEKRGFKLDKRERQDQYGCRMVWLPRKLR